MYWLFFVTSCIFFFAVAFVIWLFTFLFDRRLYILHTYSSFWGSVYIWLNPLWRVRILGRENAKAAGPCIMVCNHQSMLDILVLYNLFLNFKFVSKKGIFRLPLIGWLMRMNRYLEVDRKKPESYHRLLRSAAMHLERGSALLMFPEGTRRPAGGLGNFKEGAFRMALQNRVPLLPIVLEGTGGAMSGKFPVMKKKQTIYVSVMTPIPYSFFRDMPPADLLEHTRKKMKKTYADLKRFRNNQSS